MPNTKTDRQPKILQWFPMYVHRLTGSSDYRALKDYQQAWYLNLLFECWISKKPGYLPDDGQLWRFANARTEQFFKKECDPVLRMFEREGPTADGSVEIYDPVLVETYYKQVEIHYSKRKSSKSTKDNLTSYLDFGDSLKKPNAREDCSLHPDSGRTVWGTCWSCYAGE
jgi:hypothetical protein